MSDFFRPRPLSNELSALLIKGFHFDFIDDMVFPSDDVRVSMIESTRMLGLADNFDVLPDSDSIDFVHVCTWKGIGLASRQPVKRGTDICVCYGDVFENGSHPDDSDYCLQTPGGHIIYFKNKSGLNRFIQSSCVANCMWEPRWRNGLCFLVLVAMEDIPEYTAFVYESTQMLGYGKTRFICRCEEGRKCRRMVAAVRPKIKFYCDKCKIQFQNKHQLYEHRLIFHYYHGAIPCDFCNLTFTSLAAYYRHCKDCDTGHHKRVMSVTFRCRTCNQLCRGPKGYMDHVDECFNQDGNVEEIDDDPDSSHGASPSIPPDTSVVGVENITFPCLPPVRPDFDVDAAVDSILVRLQQEGIVRYKSPEHIYIIQTRSPPIQKEVSQPKKKSPQQAPLRQITPPPMNLKNAGMNVRIEEPMNFFGPGRTAEEFCGRSMNVQRRQSPSPVPLPQELQLMLDSGNFNVSLMPSSPSGRQEECSTFGAARDHQLSPRSTTRGASQSPPSRRMHLRSTPPETAASPKTNSSQSSSKSHSSKLPSFSQASSSGTAKINRSYPPECKAPTIKSSLKSERQSINSSEFSDTVPLRSPTTNSPNHRAPCGRRFITPPRDLQRISEECDQNSSIVMPDLDTSFYEDDATFQNRMQQFLQCMPARISPNQQRTRAMSAPPQAPVYSPQSTGRREAGSSQRPLASVPAGSPHSSSGKNAESRRPARPTQATKGISPTWPYGWDLSPIYCSEGIPKDLDFSNIQVPFHTTPSPHDDLTFPFRMDNFFLNIGGAVVPNWNPESPNHATLGSTQPSSPTSPEKKRTGQRQRMTTEECNSPGANPIPVSPNHPQIGSPDRDMCVAPYSPPFTFHWDDSPRSVNLNDTQRNSGNASNLPRISPRHPRPATPEEDFPLPFHPFPDDSIFPPVCDDNVFNDHDLMSFLRQIPTCPGSDTNSTPPRHSLSSVRTPENIVLPGADRPDKYYEDVAKFPKWKLSDYFDSKKKEFKPEKIAEERRIRKVQRKLFLAENRPDLEPSTRVLRSHTSAASSSREVMSEDQGSDQLPGTSQQSGNRRIIVAEPSTRSVRSRSTATSSNEIMSQGSQRIKDQAQGSRQVPGSSRDGAAASLPGTSKRKLSASSVSSGEKESSSHQIPPAQTQQIRQSQPPKTQKSKRVPTRAVEPTERVLRSQSKQSATNLLSLSTVEKPAKKRSKTTDTRNRPDPVVEIRPDPMPSRRPENENRFVVIPSSRMRTNTAGVNADRGNIPPQESTKVDSDDSALNEKDTKNRKKKGSDKEK